MEKNAQTSDASARGFFIVTDEPLPVGSTVPISLMHQKWGGILNVVGRVAHIVDSRERKGMGIEIRSIGRGNDERFESYRAIIDSERFGLKPGKGARED